MATKIPSKVEEMDKAADELLKAGTKKDVEPVVEPIPDVIVPDSKDVISKPEDLKSTEVSDENWEQRYKTLEGKYRAEVPRMAETIRNLENIVKDLTDKVTKSQEVKSDKKDEVRDADEAWLEKEYPDFYRTLNKIITKRTSGADKMDEKLSRLESMTTKTAEQIFYENLEKKVPDWQTVNYDPEFKTWLQEEDGYTGMPKAQLLNVAYSNLNAKAVAKFFLDYEATKKVSSVTDGTKKVDTLDKHVTPSSRTSSKSGKDTEQEVTPDLINQYSKKLRDAVNRLDYEGAAKIEKELDELLMKSGKK